MTWVAICRRTAVVGAVAALSWLGRSSDARAASSVALVTSSRLAADQAIVELATVTVAQDRALTVLDRQAVEAALAEQEIGLSDAEYSERSVLAGQLLGVDLFAVYLPVSTSDDSARFVVFETTGGARLLDVNLQSSAADDATARAAEIAELLRRGVAKNAALQHAGLRFVSFHGFRNVDLPVSWMPRFERIRRRLEQELASQEGVAVLERAHLKYVNAERTLPVAQFHARLLACATNLVVQFSRGRDAQSATVTVAIYSPAQSEPRTLSAAISEDDSADELAALAIEARRLVLAGDVQRLPHPRDADPSGQSEARRLRAEARRLFARDEWRDAAVFSECVYALEPDSLRDLSYLIFALDYYAENLLKALRVEGAPVDRERADATLSEAIDIMNYRLDLVVQLHERRKSEPHWHVRMTAHRGDFPPWSRCVLELGALAHKGVVANDHQVRACLERFYGFWFGELVRYQQQQVQSADEARRIIGEKYHLDYLRHVARTQDEQVDLSLEQYDGWARMLNERGWNRDRPDDEAAWSELMELLEFHEYARAAMSDRRLDLLLQRLEALADHRAPRIARRARFDAARIEIDRRMKQDSVARRDSEWDVEDDIEELAAPILAELSKDFAPPAQGDVGPLGVLSAEMAATPFDRRLTQLTQELNKIGGLHPDMRQARRARGELFYQCLQRDVFSPALFYGGLPPYVYNRSEHASLGEENLAERVAYYDEALGWLRTGQGKRSTPALDTVVAALEVELVRDRRTLASFGGFAPRRDAADEAFPVVTPWSRLTLLAGSPGLPETRDDRSRARVAGFAFAGGDIFYLSQHPQAAESMTCSLSGFRVEAKGPQKVVRFNGATVTASRADLNQEERTYYEVIRSDLDEASPNPVAVDERFLYWNRIAHGVLVLPLDGSTPFSFDELSGLPSDFVQAIAAANGKLYAWVGRPQKESILVEASPVDRTVRVLASSERVEAVNELDALRPATTKLMYFDAPRNRLVFWRRKQIWTWDLATDRPKGILDIPWEEDCWLRNVVVIPHKQRLLINRTLDLWTLDLASDECTRTILPAAPLHGVGPPSLVLGDKAWIRAPWSLYDLTSHRRYALRLPLRDQRPPPMHWRPWCEALDEERCLIWDQYHLWLADLRSELRPEHAAP